MSSAVYSIITDRVVSLLERGVVPWRKPWAGSDAMPRYLVSGRDYRGVNVFLLACSEYASPNWLTFKQAQARGGSVRKGEKAIPVVFWKVDHVQRGRRWGVGRRSPIHPPLLQRVQCRAVQRDCRSLSSLFPTRLSRSRSVNRS